MAKEIINVGQAANDGTGDPLRNAFEKVNSNFTELYDTADTQDLDFTGDSGTGSVELDSQTLNLVGTNGVQTTANGQTITIDTSSLDTRLTTAEADIDTNTASITTEETARIAADTTLQTNIDSEASTRASADTSEAATRLANDNTLQGNIDTEASTRATADTTLQTNIDAEATTRGSADTTLQTNIDSEAATRLANDNTLQSNIDAEAATRLANDNTLQGNIDTEASTRSSADTALQGQIDSNDTDIATNAANIATNTTNISSNDTDISGLDTRLTTAEGNITSNDTDITGLDNRLTTAEGNISSNDTDIATNASNIATNVTNIATNVTNIASNDTDISNLQSSKQNISEKNQANGYAPLDSGAKIPIANLPDSVVGQVEYQGTWDASIDDPTLPSASTVKGHYYVVSVGGTYETITYAIGDWIISNGVAWEKIDNTDAVTTVFGRLGAIVANEGDYSSYYPLIADLTAAEADITTNATNISTNTSNISTNTSDIATNASNISSNDTDITALQNDKYDKTGGTITGNATITGNLIVDTDTLYVNSSTNNIGIGTASPDAKLDVESTVDYQIMAKYNATNYTEYGYFGLNVVGSGNPYVFKMQGTERMRIDSSGVVTIKNDLLLDDGIGRLTLDSISGANRIMSTTTAFGAYEDLQFRADNYIFSTGSTELMRITSGGDISFRDTSANEAFYWDASTARLGIGTDSPSFKLDVLGDSKIQYQSGATNNNAPSSLILSNTTTGAHAAGVGSSLQFEFNNTSGGFAGAKISSEANADANGSDLVFYPRYYGYSEAMRIESSGNVGIGGSPTAPLHRLSSAVTTKHYDTNASTIIEGGESRVQICANDDGSNGGGIIISNATKHWGIQQTGVSDGNALEIGNYTSSATGVDVFLSMTPRMRIDSSGNIGIGTATPDAKLHLKGGSLRIDNSVGLTANIILTEGSGDENILLEYDGTGAGSDNYFSIYSNVSSWVGKGLGFNYIPSNGRVGIGTNSPLAKTHIKTGTSGHTWASLSTNYDDLAIEGSGNTGITIFTQNVNNAAIAFADEDSNFQGAIIYANNDDSMHFWTDGTERMRITSAGAIHLSQGTGNAFVGTNAGNLGTNTGTNNSAFGLSSLLSNTTGNQNTANGVNALSSNTTGYQNTATGLNALFNNTIGYQNTAIGIGALINNTTGANNTAIGNNAQASSATVSNEVILGNSAVTTLRCNTQTISSLSDIRDKKDIKELQGAEAFIKELKPVSFVWNQRDGGRVDIDDNGFIAQDLIEAQEKSGHKIPNLVLENNPEKLEAAYGAMLPTIVSALQSALKEIDLLKTEIETLKNK